MIAAALGALLSLIHIFSVRIEPGRTWFEYILPSGRDYWLTSGTKSAGGWQLNSVLGQGDIIVRCSSHDIAKGGIFEFVKCIVRKTSSNDIELCSGDDFIVGGKGWCSMNAVHAIANREIGGDNDLSRFRQNNTTLSPIWNSNIIHASDFRIKTVNSEIIYGDVHVFTWLVSAVNDKDQETYRPFIFDWRAQTNGNNREPSSLGQLQRVSSFADAPHSNDDETNRRDGIGDMRMRDVFVKEPHAFITGLLFAAGNLV